MTLCSECTKRNICKTLCPEAEAYAKQDERYLREKTVGLPMYANNQWPKPKIKSTFTPIETRILQFLIAGKNRKHILQVLGITRNTLEKHISNIRKKAEEKFTIYRETCVSSRALPIKRQENKESDE